MQRIFAAHGLQLIDLQELPTHGGSLRLFAAQRCRPTSAGHGGRRSARGRVTGVDYAGMRSAAFYRDFQRQALRIKGELSTAGGKCQARGLKVGAMAVRQKAQFCSTLPACGLICCPGWLIKTRPS